MEEELKPKFDYIRFLRRMLAKRWKLIVLVFLGIALPAVLWVFFFSSKMYEATATVFLDSSKDGPSFLSGLLSQEGNALHVAILYSRSLAVGVVDSLPRESIDELLKRAGQRDYVLSIQNTIRRLLGQEVIVYSPKERAVKELQEARMSFKVAKDGTAIIAAAAFNPRVAMDLANTYVDVLLARSSSYAREQARSGRELVEGLIVQTRTGLLEAEEAFRKFQSESGGGAKLPEQSKLELAKLAELENALAEIQVNKEIAQAKLAYLRGEPQKTGKGRPAAADPAAQPLRERLTQLEAKLSALTEKYTDQHPLVLSTRTEIQDAQERLKLTLQGAQTPRPGGATAVAPAERAGLAKQMADLEVEIASLQAKEDGINQRVSRLKRSLTALSARELEYSRLARTMETQRNLFSTLSEKLTAARINEQSQIRSIKVIDQATLPQAPSSKPLTRVLLLGIFGGLALGAGLAALLEYANEVVETEEDVVRVTGFPVLGSIPVAQADDSSASGDGVPVSFMESCSPFSLPAEACRTIRTSLEFQEPGRALKTLLVTSPGAAEGKTTVLLNLGCAFWETGRRILMVDADLRRPSLHKAFQIPNEAGLADLLRGNVAWEDTCRQVKEGLHFIPSGIEPSNPGALLNSRQMGRALSLAREKAEIIMLDSPPILAVSDNLALISLVDGIVLVVRSGRTKRRALARAKVHLEKVRARLIGVVVNGLSPRDTKRYYSEYSSYVGGSENGYSWRKRLSLRNLKLPERVGSFSVSAGRRVLGYLNRRGEKGNGR